MLLKKIAATNDGILLTPFNLGNGVSIQVGQEIIASESPNRRDYAKWDVALKSCLNLGYIEQKNKDFYAMTNAGYKCVDEYGITKEKTTRILYVSNSMSEDEVALFRTDCEKFVNANEYGIDVRNHKVLYKLCGIAIFKRKVDEFLNQNVVVTAQMGDILIESITTFDNWKSKSYANNILSAEEYECAIWFKILSDKDNLCKVQILLIEEC